MILKILQQAFHSNGKNSESNQFKKIMIHLSRSFLEWNISLMISFIPLSSFSNLKSLGRSSKWTLLVVAAFRKNLHSFFIFSARQEPSRGLWKYLWPMKIRLLWDSTLITSTVKQITQNFRVLHLVFTGCGTSCRLPQMAETLPTRRKTLNNQSINQSINQIYIINDVPVINDLPVMVSSELPTLKLFFLLCLFASLRFIVPLENFPLMWIISPLPVKGCDF